MTKADCTMGMGKGVLNLNMIAGEDLTKILGHPLPLLKAMAVASHLMAARIAYAMLWASADPSAIERGDGYGDPKTRAQMERLGEIGMEIVRNTPDLPEPKVKANEVPSWVTWRTLDDYKKAQEPEDITLFALGLKTGNASLVELCLDARQLKPSMSIINKATEWLTGESGWAAGNQSEFLALIATFNAKQLAERIKLQSLVGGNLDNPNQIGYKNRTAP